MTIPREFIELLLTKIDIVDLINAQIPLRKKSGSNYFARCPFHNEKSASFSVSQPKQFYHCFGCGAHGNAIDFVMQHDRLNFPEAIDMLARTAGMEVPKTPFSAKKEESISSLYDLMIAVADHYYHEMCQSPRAIQYLKSRGISGKIAQQFLLGYAPSHWDHLIKAFGKSEADHKKLLDTGLIIKKEAGSYYDRFRDRILFPIHDYRGRIIGFGGRVIDQGEPKYLNSPETPLFQKGHELYGLYQALKAHRKLERVLIVEGYMDVIALFQHDITYAVATLGTATTHHHLQRLFRYTSDIIFCFDGDTAGKTAAWRALQVALPLMQDHWQVRFLFLPDNEDPDSFIRKEGKAAFEARLSSAHSLSSFFFQTLGAQSDMNAMEGRSHFAAAALKLIRELPDILFRSVLLDELSKRSRIDINSLKQQMKGHEKARVMPEPERPSTSVNWAKIDLPTPIRLALILLIQSPSLAASLRQPLPSTTLPGLDLLFQLIEIINKNPKITTGGLLEYWRDQPEAPLIAQLAHWQHMVPEAGLEKEFLGAIRQLTQLGTDQEINYLLSKAAQDSLSDEEKQQLSLLIAKKKDVVI